MEQVVEQLLDGENFNFGNPFLDWLVHTGLFFWIPTMNSVVLNDGLILCSCKSTPFECKLLFFRGTNVCSGKAHPDQIVSQEECLRADKRRYYADLEKYHNEYVHMSLFRL